MPARMSSTKMFSRRRGQPPRPRRTVYFSMVETGVLVRELGTCGAWPLRWAHRSPRSWSASCVPGGPAHPAARDALRPASVLGIGFAFSLLTALCRGRPAGAALESSAPGPPAGGNPAPEPIYRFRHALIQEATYGGMLRPERRQLHGLAALALRGLVVERAWARRGRPASLGRHYAAAGEPARAVHYFEVAGDHAVEAFANDEAVTSFRARHGDGGGPGQGFRATRANGEDGHRPEGQARPGVLAYWAGASEARGGCSARPSASPATATSHSGPNYKSSWDGWRATNGCSTPSSRNTRCRSGPDRRTAPERPGRGGGGPVA